MLLPTAYLAPVSWYLAAFRTDSVIINDAEPYVKQTFRNRCCIAMPDGPQNLIVPVEAAPNHTPVRDIRISEHGRWRHHHWNALRTAYGKSPFFEYYADDFAPFYQTRRHDFLIDFNADLHRLITAFIEQEDLVPPFTPPSSNIHDVTRSNKVSLSSFPDITAPMKPYYQVFADRLGFLPDLSIVDLLFNMGPESLLYLRQDL